MTTAKKVKKIAKTTFDAHDLPLVARKCPVDSGRDELGLSKEATLQDPGLERSIRITAAFS